MGWMGNHQRKRRAPGWGKWPEQNPGGSPTQDRHTPSTASSSFLTRAPFSLIHTHRTHEVCCVFSLSKQTKHRGMLLTSSNIAQTLAPNYAHSRSSRNTSGLIDPSVVLQTNVSFPALWHWCALCDRKLPCYPPIIWSKIINNNLFLWVLHVY